MNQTCKVCGEPAAGFHFGAFTCEGCKVSQSRIDLQSFALVPKWLPNPLAVEQLADGSARRNLVGLDATGHCIDRAIIAQCCFFGSPTRACENQRPCRQSRNNLSDARSLAGCTRALVCVCVCVCLCKCVCVCFGLCRLMGACARPAKCCNFWAMSLCKCTRPPAPAKRAHTRCIYTRTHFRPTALDG